MLEIHNPYLTIAAQTAPGEGVTLKNYGVDVYADEVMLRYLRVRPGDVADVEQEAVNVRSRNVIIDHCSVSWGTDETLSIIDEATDVTVLRPDRSEPPHPQGHVLSAPEGIGEELNAGCNTHRSTNKAWAPIPAGLPRNRGPAGAHERTRTSTT